MRWFSDLRWGLHDRLIDSVGREKAVNWTYFLLVVGAAFVGIAPSVYAVVSGYVLLGGLLLVAAVSYLAYHTYTLGRDFGIERREIEQFTEAPREAPALAVGRNQRMERIMDKPERLSALLSDMPWDVRQEAMKPGAAILVDLCKEWDGAELTFAIRYLHRTYTSDSNARQILNYALAHKMVELVRRPDDEESLVRIPVDDGLSTSS